MKRISNAAALLWMAAVSAFASGVADEESKTRGKASGSIVSETRALPRFTSVKLSGSGTVRYRESGTFRVTVTTDEAIIDRVITDVTGEDLELGLKPGFSFHNTSKIEYVVEAPGLTGISVSGSGSFSAEQPLTEESLSIAISGSGGLTAQIEAESLSVRISGSGEVEARIDAGTVDARISGSGSMRISGTADSLEFDGGGSGELLARDFSVQGADLRLSGLGNVELGIADRLKVRLSGSGSVGYRGRPLLDYASSGSGRIRSLD